MKKMMVLFLLLASSYSFASIRCTGNNIDIRVNPSAKSLQISGKYEGTINSLRGSGVEYFGTASSGNFRSLTLFVDGVDSELTVIGSNGRASGIISVDCN